MAERGLGGAAVGGTARSRAAAKCEQKRRYRSRMAAESALGIARNQWRMDKTRAAQPPTGVYQCPVCDGWHLTSKSPERLQFSCIAPGFARAVRLVRARRRPRRAPRATAAETAAAARGFGKGQRVIYLGGAKAGAVPWLRAGAELTVLGPVRSRGRSYVRLIRESDEKRTTLAPHLIRAAD